MMDYIKKTVKLKKVLKDLLAFYIQNVFESFHLFLTKIYVPYNLIPFC